MLDIIYQGDALTLLPDEKKLVLSKFEAFADNFIVANKMQFLFERVENIVKKGENAGYQLFSVRQKVIRNGFLQGLKKSALYGKVLKPICQSMTALSVTSTPTSVLFANNTSVANRCARLV